MRYFILQNKEPVSVETDLQWMLWWGRVSLEDVLVASDRMGRVEFTTGFIGRTSSLEEQALVFESVRWRGEQPVIVGRYASWEDALRGHEEVVRRARRKLRGRKAARNSRTTGQPEGFSAPSDRGNPLSTGSIHSSAFNGQVAGTVST